MIEFPCPTCECCNTPYVCDQSTCEKYLKYKSAINSHEKHKEGL